MCVFFVSRESGLSSVKFLYIWMFIFRFFFGFNFRLHKVIAQMWLKLWLLAETLSLSGVS